MKIIKSLQFIFIAILISLLFVNYVKAEDGTYISQQLGEANARFTTLEAIDEYKPENCSINYYFTGNQSNYTAWSVGLTPQDGKIDLTQINEVKNSDFIQVKIVFESNEEYSPILKGFRLIYNSASGEIGETSIEISSLVSTGTNITYYLLGALIISLIIIALIFKTKKSDNAKELPDS